MAKTVVFSFDGGAIKGIIPAFLITKLEEEIKKITKNKYDVISNYVDFFAGTSTGGLLALLYNFKDKEGFSKYTAKQIYDFYLDLSKEIFPKPNKRNLYTLFGLLGEKYSKKKFEKILEKVFEYSSLRNLKRHCLITAYDINNQEGVFFTSHDYKKKDYYLKDIARATSAAPTVFEPVEVRKISTDKTLTLMDGMIIANNPSQIALTELSTKLKKEIKDIKLFSFGTGNNKNKVKFKKAKGWGLINWGLNILDLLSDGQNKMIDYSIKELFKSHLVEDQYKRFDIEFDKKVNITDSSNKNIKYLIEKANDLYEKNKEEIKNIAKELVENKKKQLCIK